FATNAQPMLWGVGKPLNWSAQSWQHFDDVNQDGVLEWNEECQDYDTGVCPGPLAAATAFFRKGISVNGKQITPKLRLYCSSNSRMIARIKNVTPDTSITYELNGVPVKNQMTNHQGKDRATLEIARRSANTVRVPEFFLMRNHSCE